MKRTDMLLCHHRLAPNWRNAIIDGPELGFALGYSFNGNLVTPQPHVSIGITAVRILIIGGYIDCQVSILAAGFQQATNAEHNLFIDVLAGRWVARPRPSVRQVDIDQSRSIAEADPTLETALLVEATRFGERIFQSLLESGCGHFNRYSPYGFCSLPSRASLIILSAFCPVSKFFQDHCRLP